MGVEEGDSVIAVEVSDGTSQIFLGTRDGMAIRFDETDVRAMGRTAYGVRGISLRDGDEVVAMDVVRAGGTMLTVTQNGYGKRTDLEEYRVQSRGGIGIINKIRAYALQDAGADTIDANQRLGLEVDLRRYEQCAEILLDLGLGQVRVLSNNPEKMRALKAAGLEVVARVALEPAPADAATNYLRTKKEKMGHLLEMV